MSKGDEKEIRTKPMARSLKAKVSLILTSYRFEYELDHFAIKQPLFEDSL